MMMLRFIIPPMWWFVEVDKKKPRCKQLDSSVKKPSFKKSKAFKKLLEVPIKAWVKAGFQYQPVYCLKKGKINNITFNRMIEFSSKINVQDWFVYEN